MSGRGAVVWFTGLPSSGKTTLARKVARALAKRGRAHLLLDGDEVRAALTPTPGYGPKARSDFYRTLGALAVMLARQGQVVLVAATANRRAFRDWARKRAPRFVEVYVDTPLEVCIRRNAKGLYGRARALPGVGVRYEAPRRPEVRGTSVEAVLRALGR